jgi:uncharacterized membrane protein (DUF106 family)
MRWLNAALGGLVSTVLYPFQGLPPITGLAFVAVLTSVAILLVYRATSDQKALRRVKNRITAGILEILLFRDDLRAIVQAQWDIFRHTLTYMRLSLVPMLWVIVPIVLLMIQLQFHYGYRPLQPGESAIVTATLAGEDGSVEDGELRLNADDGLEVETPLLLIPAVREADWRVGALSDGSYQLLLEMDGQELAKSVVVGRYSGTISPRRPSAGLLDQLLYPVEPPVPGDAAVEAIEVAYSTATVSFFGWDTHWMIAFFILTIVFAFVLQKPLGVTI